MKRFLCAFAALGLAVSAAAAFPSHEKARSFALWVCFPGETIRHPIDVFGVAVDGIATVSTVAASGRVVARVNVVRNHFFVPDDGFSNGAVKIVFKSRAGRTVLVRRADTPITTCSRGGPTPAPVPGV